jgi:class 3 adenylate cyclase/tetratricopeptide (TPR) repeat protein
VNAEDNFCPACGGQLTRSGPYGVELRDVACLAADVQGLAKLLGTVPTSSVSDFVGECMSALEESCASFGGTIINRHSAGLSAIFGAPVAREREVELAVQAALRARDGITELSGRIYTTVGQGLAARFAVDFGLVRAGGFVAAADYVALGAPVENAARLRNNARPNTVLLSSAAAEQVKPLFKLRPVALGTTGADGRAETGFLVEGAADALPPRPARRRSFVGRAKELARLSGILRELGAGRGAVIGVAGDAGSGKTRLISEALAGFEKHPVAVGRCLPVTTGITYAAIRNLLSRALEGRPGENVAERAESLIREYHPESEEALPLLRLAFDTSRAGAAGVEQVEGGARREKLAELIRQVLEGLTRDGPRVVVLEDVQWASNSDVELLSRMEGWAAELPLLVIVSARDRKTVERITSNVVALAPLSAEEVEELIRELVPRERLNPTLIRRVVELSLGTPLYCEEVASAVSAGGAVETSRPPASIKAAARARADKLTPRALRLAKVAACVGLEAEEDFVRELCPDDIAGDCAELMGELEREGILKLEEGRLVFTHDVMRDVLYESLVHKEREATLAEVSRVAEGRGVEPGVVAHYLLEAGRNREAVERLKEAGDRAAAAYALMEAISHYQRAFENLRDTAPDDINLKLEIIDKLALALVDYAEPRKALELAEAEFKYAETPAVRAKLLYLAGRAYLSMAEYRRALLYLEDARKVYKTLGDPLMEGQTLKSISNAYSALGDAAARRRTIADALARFTDAGDDVGVGFCYNAIGADYQNADEATKALEYFEEALYIWQQSGYLPGQAIALTNLGVGHFLMGRNREAADFAEKALGITRRIGTRRVQSAAATNLAAIFRYLDPRKAEEYGRGALALATDISNYEAMTAANVNLGEIERSRGRWDTAREHVAAALEAATHISTPYIAFEAHLLGAKIELDVGEYDGEAFGRHYEALYKLEPPFRGTAALARMNLEAALALEREDRNRAALLTAELRGRVAAAKKADEIYEGRIRLGELEVFTGNAISAAAEFQWVMGQTEGGNVVHWPWAAFGLARAMHALGRRDEAVKYTRYAEEIFAEYGWLYWTDRIARFRVRANL